MNKLFVVIFIFFTGWVKSQPVVQQIALKTDTIILSSNVGFISDLQSIIITCLDEKHYGSGTFTYLDALSTISMFNNELNTKVFKKISIITGVFIKITEEEDWIRVMEWSFQDEITANKVENKLKKLDRGIIKDPIIPTACYFVKSGNKIYILVYSPRKKGNKSVDDFFSCLKSSIQK
jgi:hypothetical protein